VADYYGQVARFLLPHLRNRSVTLNHFPNGVYGEMFYEKDAPGFTPSWVKTFRCHDVKVVPISIIFWLKKLARCDRWPLWRWLRHWKCFPVYVDVYQNHIHV